MSNGHIMLTRLVISLMVVVVLLIALWPLLPGSARKAHAMSVEGGRGVAAIFVRWNGADGLGHIGWAFQTDYDLQTQRNSYWYGSVENPSGKVSVPAGDPLAVGFWDKYGDWGDVMHDFQAL